MDSTYNLQLDSKMKNRGIKHLAILSLGALVMMLSSYKTASTDYPGLRVICNAYAPVPSLSQYEFEQMIQGEKQRWKGGDGVIVALLKTSHPTGMKVAEEIFEMNDNEFNRYWLSLVFAGKSKAPNFFTSEEDLLEFVMVTPGAIGVVSTNVSTVGVKELSIE